MSACSLFLCYLVSTSIQDFGEEVAVVAIDFKLHDAVLCHVGLLGFGEDV